MKRVIILIDRNGKIRAFSSLKKLYKGNEYCQWHQYRIGKAIGQGKEYNNHGVKVIRLEMNNGL